MKKLLDKQQVEKDISQTWEHITGVPDEDEHRQDLVNAAMQKQEDSYKQLDLQDKILQKAWVLCHRINPTDPLSALELLNKYIPHPETIGSL